MERIEYATTLSELATIRDMCLEYAQSLGVDLETQHLSQELAELPGKYGPPTGCLLLATVDDVPAGCIALKPLSAGICEMKRLYVRPQYRDTGLGRRLAERLIAQARGLGYNTMRLDTLRKLDRALNLYRSMGFTSIAPYWNNVLPGV